MKTIIKDLRTAAGLTQQQLANQVRVTVRTINSIERGEYNPGKSKLFGVLLVLAAFFSFYLGDITTLTPPQKATAGVALVILVLLALIFALRPKKTEEDLIAEQDERKQYIELKCAAKAFRVALHASFMTIIAGMIAFGLTREYAFIWLVMGGILPYGASRIAYIVSAFRYDK